jgi:DNA-binding beta-propeller fold protein YncE
MARRSTTLAMFGVCGLLATHVSAQSNRLYVLDSGVPALAVVDVSTGKRVADVALAGAPSWLVLSDDGRYVVALDYGPGEAKGDRGYKATARSSATIVDATSLEPIGRVELGYGLDSVLTGADGRLTVTCPGYDAKDPKEALPRELVVVELATARETGRLTLEPGTDLTWRSRDGATLALLQGQPRTAKYPFPASRIQLVEVAGPRIVATLSAGGWDQVERDDEHVYLFVRGRPDKDPQKNKNGSVEVVSFGDRRVERIDVGRSPMGGLQQPGGLLAVLSEGSGDEAPGELRLLRDGKLAATLPVAARPKYLGEMGAGLCVVGAKAVTLVDVASQQVTATIPLEKAGEEIVGGGDHPFEVVGTADGRRAFIHYPAEDKVAVLDLEQKRAIGATKTGRGSKKLLGGMMSFLTYGMSDRMYFYRSGDPPQMLVRRDGRFAYALNLETGDVTIVDADTASAVQKLGTGGNQLALLGASTLVAVGREIRVIDTARNAMGAPLSLPGVRGFLAAPDGSVAVALAEHALSIIDGATGRERTRISFVKPSRAAFAKDGAVAEARP